MFSKLFEAPQSIFSGIEANERTGFWMQGRVPLAVPGRFGIPAPANQVLKWFQGDSEEHYREFGNRSYGPDDVEYRFNSYGYRSREIDPSSPSLKVMYVGCSFTFGTGLPEHEVWTTVTTEHLKNRLGREVETHNFGLPGFGSDTFSMIVAQVLPILKPDLLVVLFSDQSRRTHYHTWDDRQKLLVNVKAGVDPSVRQAFLTLQSDPQDWYEWCRNFNLIDLAAKAGNVPWVWQSINPSYIPNEIGGYVRTDNRITTDFPAVASDTVMARDNVHPGAPAHREFADAVAEYVHSGGYLTTPRG